MISLPPPKRIISPGNDLYPLPSDYAALTAKGQWQARINGCRQWQLRTPAYDPAAWWGSYMLFDLLYLRNQEHSYFYDSPPTVWGPQQRHLLETISQHNKTIVVWPRGFTKTTTLAIFNLMVLTTMPRNKVFYLTSIVKKAREAMMRRCMKEWEQNEPLIIDWANEAYDCPRGFVPPRGTSDSWSAYNLNAMLCNGSSLIGGAIDAATRGERAPFIELDDPEKDFKTSTDTEKARSYLEMFLFKTLKPVLNRRSLTRLLWTGTRISARHYLYEATNGDDPRFEYWKKSVFMAASPSFGDRKKALWPQHMSLADIDQEIKEMGAPYVLSEYFNEPGQAINQAFWVDEKKQGYRLLREDGTEVNDADPWAHADPYDCDYTISYLSPKTEEPVAYKLSDLLRRSLVIQTNDWAKSMSTTADFSCTSVGVYGYEGELIPLDVRLGRWMPSERSTHVLHLSFRWRPSIVAFEAFSPSHEIMVRANADYAEAAAKLGYKPRVKRIPIHGAGNKADKVHAIAWRFGDEKKPEGFIKLPFWLEGRHPGFTALLSQIRGANFESEDLGLPHDDAVDTLRMMQDAVGFRAGMTSPPSTLVKLDARERLLKGETVDEHGIPLIERVGLDNLSSEEEDQIVEAIHDAESRRDRQGAHRRFRYV